MSDVRVLKAMLDLRLNDSSFTEKGFLGFTKNYSQAEVRDIWFQGIELGINTGLNMATLEGQRIEIDNNIQNERHRLFYDEFLKLSTEYNCAIQYHPELGMCVIDNI